LWGRGKNNYRATKSGGEGSTFLNWMKGLEEFSSLLWKWGRGKTITGLPKVGEKGVPF